MIDKDTLTDREKLLLADLERLKAALQPFADHAEDWLHIGAGLDENLVEEFSNGPKHLPLTVGHLVAARVAINKSN